MDGDYCLVATTVADRDGAGALASSVVAARLAACVQMLSIDSVYRWEGEVCREPEILLLMKTRTAVFDALSEHIRCNHPYDVPEIIRIPVAGGSSPYLSWIDEMTGG